ncbi:hypothetical protein SDC9_104553 [bioreactor metagenome]|uniref:Uncharacterized protein n=1 Tax=bioreactor metagenome TaxID=1076179 RepID=A0A645AX39_9ZZZZ
MLTSLFQETSKFQLFSFCVPDCILVLLLDSYFFPHLLPNHALSVLLILFLEDMFELELALFELQLDIVDIEATP